MMREFRTSKRPGYSALVENPGAPTFELSVSSLSMTRLT